MVEQRWSPACERPSGLAFPEHLDPTGENGPTRVQARSARWEWLAPGWYARADRPDCVEQRILDAACRLRNGDAVTAWAALRWRGGAFFDGLAAGGSERLPVPLIARCSLGVAAGAHPEQGTARAQRVAVRRGSARDDRAACALRRGGPPQRAVGECRGDVHGGRCAASYRRDSSRNHLLHRSAWTGVPLARKAAGLARDDLRSPPEVRLHLTWELVAELSRGWPTDRSSTSTAT